MSAARANTERMKAHILRVLAVLAVAALGAPAVAAEPVNLTVALIPSESAAQAFDAQDQGFFKAAGLNVTLMPFPASPPIIAAVSSGAADIGNSVVGSVVAARSRGINVKFFAAAGLYLATSPTARLVGLRGTSMHTGADLAGKTVAVTGLADLTFFATKQWVEQTGGNPNSMKFIELPEPEMLPALKSRRIDAGILIEPFVASAGDDIDSIAPIDDYIAKRFLATGWIASDGWLAAHPDVAAKFAAVMKQTAEWANAHRKESAAILLKHTKLTSDVVARMNRATYATALETRDLQPVIDNSAKYGGFPRPVTAAELMWTPGK
jgi:NitT/TauT family transport system substrate-binding protein